jgi:ABC-type transport system involved in multi-copper enzyme maturation permease subunit
MYQHEIFKTRKQLFYKIAFIFPIILNFAFVLIAVFISIIAKAPIVGADKAVVPVNQTPYDLGSGGTFTALATIMLINLAPIYNIIIVIACAMMVASEYRSGTIKMLATRQPSRIRLTLAKCLTAITFVTVISLIFMVAWLIAGLVMKPVSNLPLEITAQDWDAIGKTIYYHTVQSIRLIILALVAVALTFLFKSIVGGVVGYFVLLTADAALNGLGVGLAINGVPATAPDWQKPLLEIVRFIHPFLLGSNVDRLTQAEQYQGMFFDPVNRTFVAQIVDNQRVNFGMSPVWSWAMLAAYIVFFIGYTCWTFARRDIND